MGKYVGQEDEVYHKALEMYVFKKGPKVWQPLIEAMYRRFNPAKLETLKDILQKYKGDEAGLFKALCNKYVPTLSEGDAPLELCDWTAAESEEEDGSVKSAVDSSSPSPCSSKGSKIRMVSPSPDSSSVEAQSSGQPRSAGAQRTKEYAHQQRDFQQQREQQQQPRQQKHPIPQPQHQAAAPEPAGSQGRPGGRQTSTRQRGREWMPRSPRNSGHGQGDRPRHSSGDTSQAPGRTNSRSDLQEQLSSQRRESRRGSRPHTERSPSPSDRRNGGHSRVDVQDQISSQRWESRRGTRHSRGEIKTAAILRPASNGNRRDVAPWSGSAALPSREEREWTSRRQAVVLKARSRTRTTEAEDRARVTRHSVKQHQQQQQQQQHQQRSRSRSKGVGGVVYRKAQAREPEVTGSRRHREVPMATFETQEVKSNDRHPPPWKEKKAARTRTRTPSARRRWHSPRSPSTASVPRAVASSSAGSQSKVVLADSEAAALSRAAASALPTASSEEEVPQSCSSAAQRPLAPSSMEAQPRRPTLPTPQPPQPVAQSSSGSGGKTVPSSDDTCGGAAAAAAADATPSSSSGSSAHLVGKPIAIAEGGAASSSSVASLPPVEKKDNGCVAATTGHDELVGFEALQAFVKAAPQVDRTQKRRPKSLKARVEYNGQQVEFELSNKSTLAEVAVMFSRWLSVQCGMAPAIVAVPADIGVPPGNLGPAAAAAATAAAS